MNVDYFCNVGQPKVWEAIDKLAKEHGVTGGVYRVHALRHEGLPEPSANQTAPVQRLLGPDPSGRLYIGMAGDFRYRFITLFKSVSPKHVSFDSHAFGKAYRGLDRVRQAFPHLAFSLSFSSNPRSAEASEIEQYAVEFGERPPFNAMG